MSLQRYRADVVKPQADGSVASYARWMGGDSLALVRNCRLALAGDMRRTVYVTGEPDTWFSQPAACRLHGCTVRGYLTRDDDGMIFRPTYY